MPLAKTKAIALFGLSGTLIDVEADISSNLPNFILVGLPDASLSESTSRVRAACTNSELALPGRRITVNLSPAAVPKRGSSFDLAIAVSVLAAAGMLKKTSVAEWLHIGELTLDGGIRRVNGVLPSLLAAKELGWSKFIVPSENLAEAKALEGIEIQSFDHLTQVAQFHGSEVAVKAPSITPGSSPQADKAALCYSDVLGQDETIEAMVIAATGGHHILMVGSPGSGKTMIAERLSSILPELSPAQAIETAAVESLSGLPGGVSYLPPFRAPHHNSSASSLIGGGLAVPRPGVISLAHNGVLFLDEAPEFQQPALEALRQPLEAGEVFITRAAGVAKFPARFQLVMAANPCPCGFAWDPKRACKCVEPAKSRYLNRLSGPLLDRIDISLRVNAVPKALQGKRGPASVELRERVKAGRDFGQKRLARTPWVLNAQVPGSYLRRHWKPAGSAVDGLDRALERGLVSMRGYDRCLRLAFTLADLDQVETPTVGHISRAMFLRGAELG
jgi:magnesium chelatase family protein